MPDSSHEIAPLVREARVRLDAHTREIVAWHFDPATGCPFWLEFAAKLGWDPRKEIQSDDDLDKFPPFQDEWLRGGPVRRWVPKAYAERPIYVFETGGSTGVPKSRINIDDFRIDYEMFSETLDDAYFPKGADWLMLGPSGPRRLRLAVEHLAHHRGGISFGLDLDPRWVTKLVKSGRMDLMHEYKDHVINQALTLLKAHDTIRCLFATPKLLEAICERVSLVKSGITGVFCGGTQMTPQFHRFACEELLEGGPEWWKDQSRDRKGAVSGEGSGFRVQEKNAETLPRRRDRNAEIGGSGLDRKMQSESRSRRAGTKSAMKIAFVPTYGNTLMGLACHKPFDPADDYAIIYHPPLPRAVIEVVDPASTEDPDVWYEAPSHGKSGRRHRLVEYGEQGRVRLTTLTKEFFMPRFLERDEAIRTPPCDPYPWDGAANVRPFSGFATPIVEGVY